MDYSMIRRPSYKHCNVQALGHKVKCDCSVQRIGTNTNNLSASAYTIVYLSRNRYTYFLNKASKVGVLHWTWWLPGLYTYFLNKASKVGMLHWTWWLPGLEKM